MGEPGESITITIATMSIIGERTTKRIVARMRSIARLMKKYKDERFSTKGLRASGSKRFIK
jgi:hypothetical protein